jgi:uncharacterized protein YcfJ
MLVASAASADGARFEDLARVVSIEPIVDRIYEPVRRRECITEQRRAPLLPLAATIGEDIRRQHRLARPQPRCRWVEERAPVERIRGYWVTYDYGGQRHTRRMDQAPGDLLPVRVALEPLR